MSKVVKLSQSEISTALARTRTIHKQLADRRISARGVFVHEVFFRKCLGEESTDTRVIHIIRSKDGMNPIRHPADNNAT